VKIVVDTNVVAYLLLGTRPFVDEASGIAVDDTLFVELAARTACPLVTFDKVVLKAFPDIAIRPRDLTEG
jgi:hypothetical protein